MDALFRLFLLVLLVPPQLAHAGNREGGDGGAIDHGGGGTFISDGRSKQIKFWDLYLFAPWVDDSTPGDRLELPAGVGGEFVSPVLTPKSSALLEQRLRLWRPRLPKLSAALDRLQTQSLNKIATRFSITQATEIAIPVESEAPPAGAMAIPGAFYGYERRIVFIDVGVWNQAGLLSQAALLLHERLRGVQLRYPEFSNDELERMVAMILASNPADAWPGDDAKFDPKFFRDPGPGPQLAGAQEEVAGALASGILGAVRGDAPLRQQGRRNGVYDLGGTVLLDPLSCPRRLGEILGSEVSSFRCDVDGITGEGTLPFRGSFKYELWVDVSALFTSADARLTVEALEPARAAPGTAVTFSVANSRLVMQVGGVARAFDLPDPAGEHVYSLRFSRQERTFEIVRDDRYSRNSLPEEVTLAKVRLPQPIPRPGTFEDFRVSVAGGVKLRFVRMNTEYDPNTP
jgi:hypothetical protein